MTERTRSQIQAAEISFFRWVAEYFLRDRVTSSVTWEELGVEPMPLRIEVCQMGMCFSSSEEAPEELLGHAGETVPLGWSGSTSESSQKELKEVSEVREVWTTLLKLLPPGPSPGYAHIKPKYISLVGFICKQKEKKISSHSTYACFHFC